MKTHLNVLAAALLSFTGTASATPVVLHIVGTPTCSVALHKAILHCFTSSVSVAVNEATRPQNAVSAAYFRGTLFGRDTIVETNLEGSEGGIYSTTHYYARPFFADATNSLSGCKTVTAGSDFSTLTFSSGTNGGLLSLPGTNAVYPEVVLSDIFQNSTTYYSPTLSGVSGAWNAYDTYGIVGVVPFSWVKGKTSVAAVANFKGMTSQTVQTSYGSLGYLGLAMFTGLPADETVYVYAAGMNPASGARAVVFGEAGLGVLPFVQQWHPPAGSYTVSQLVINASGTIPTLGGLTASAGDNGEYLGTTISSYLGQTCTNGVLVGYLGATDINDALNKGATALSWNGASLYSTPTNPATFTPNAIREGQYTLWSYAQMLYNSASCGATQLDAAVLVAKQLYYTDAAASGLIDITTMHVTRYGEGTLVTPNF